MKGRWRRKRNIVMKHSVRHCHLIYVAGDQMERKKDGVSTQVVIGHPIAEKRSLTDANLALINVSTLSDGGSDKTPVSLFRSFNFDIRSSILNCVLKARLITDTFISIFRLKNRVFFLL